MEMAGKEGEQWSSEGHFLEEGTGQKLWEKRRDKAQWLEGSTLSFPGSEPQGDRARWSSQTPLPLHILYYTVEAPSRSAMDHLELLRAS